jgi:hypothetical protein
MNFELQSDEFLITSQEQFTNKLNELLSNGYCHIDESVIIENIILDVSRYYEFLDYEKILVERSAVDILFFKIDEEHKKYSICIKKN